MEAPLKRILVAAALLFALVNMARAEAPLTAKEARLLMAKSASNKQTQEAEKAIRKAAAKGEEYVNVDGFCASLVKLKALGFTLRSNGCAPHEYGGGGCSCNISWEENEK